MIDLLNIDQVVVLLGDAFSKQVTQWTIALAIAAWIHSGRVKKEIKEQLAGVTLAINELGAALRQDLKVQSERIGKIEVRMDKIELPKNNQRGNNDQLI